MAKKAKKKKPAQEYFDGMAPPKIKEIETAAEEYRDAKQKCVKWQDDKKVRKVTLDEVMLKHRDALMKNEKGQRVYRYTDDKDEPQEAVLSHSTIVRKSKQVKPISTKDDPAGVNPDAGEPLEDLE